MSSKKNKIALNSSALLLQTDSGVKNSNSTKARILKKSSAGSNMNKKRFSEAHPKQNIWLFYTVWSVHLSKLPYICYYFLNTNIQKNNELFKKRFENYKCKSFSTCSRPQNALYNLNLSSAPASNLGPK